MYTLLLLVGLCKKSMAHKNHKIANFVVTIQISLNLVICIELLLS